jgi:hypothetical protein
MSVTDYLEHAPGPIPALPGAGGYISDPSLNAVILQLTDPVNDPGSFPVHPQYSTRNSATSRVLNTTVGGVAKRYVHAMTSYQTYKTIDITSQPPVLVTQQPISFPNGAWWNTAWHGQNADLFFGTRLTSLSIFQTSLSTSVTTVAADLTPFVPPLAATPNGLSIIGCSWNADLVFIGYVYTDDYLSQAPIFLFNLTTGKVVASYSGFVEQASPTIQVEYDKPYASMDCWLMSPGKSNNENGTVETLFPWLDAKNEIEWDFVTPATAPLANDLAAINMHAALGLSDWVGCQGYENLDENNSNLTLIRYFSNPHKIGVLSRSDGNTPVLPGLYFSQTCFDQSTVTCTTVSPSGYSGLMDGEIYILSKDGNSTVKRLCHHWSNLSSGNYSQAVLANRSFEGDVVVFSSTMVGTTPQAGANIRNEMYLVMTGETTPVVIPAPALNDVPAYADQSPVRTPFPGGYTATIPVTIPAAALQTGQNLIEFSLAMGAYGYGPNQPSGMLIECSSVPALQTGAPGWTFRNPPMPIATQQDLCQTFIDAGGTPAPAVIVTTNLLPSFYTSKVEAKWISTTADITQCNGTSTPYLQPIFAQTFPVSGIPADITFNIAANCQVWTIYVNRQQILRTPTVAGLLPQFQPLPLTNFCMGEDISWAPIGASVTTPALQSIAISPASLAGAGSVTGTITLASTTSVAVSVALLSSSALATAPPTVIVPAGSSSASFTVTATAPSSPTLVTITGTAGAVTKAAYVDIIPLAVVSLALSPNAIQGAGTVTGTVTISAASPVGGTVIALLSSLPAAVVPPTFTILSGATSGSFMISVGSVTAASIAAITATLGATNISASLTLNPSPVATPPPPTVPPQTVPPLTNAEILDLREIITEVEGFKLN